MPGPRLPGPEPGRQHRTNQGGGRSPAGPGVPGRRPIVAPESRGGDLRRQVMESIERFVAEQLAAWEVPGCAAAAVRGGEVVLATGCGRRDLGAELPVTPDTLFAIGSVTKAFTAAAVGALVDDGLLEWEGPRREYVPDLRLHARAVTSGLSGVDR